MSIISRLTTWGTQILTSASLNGEFNNVVNTLNNLDSATSSWTNVKTGVLTVTGLSNVTGGIVGTTAGGNATAGNVGEYVESVFSAVNFPASGVFGDATSISLTAGDWDVSLNILAAWVSGTVTALFAGISTTTGNSLTGLVLGSNYAASIVPPNATNNVQTTIAAYRQSVSSTTIVYAKFSGSFTGSWQAYGRLSARRIR
jgi:hypothetical protein